VGAVNVESLLKPLSEAAPCGENLRWDRRYLEVERLAEGKEETQFSASEEPDWREVRDGCAELFARGKHLRVAVLMTLAAVRQEGYPGLRDGLKVIQGLLEQYWDPIFPQLDAEDNNDPTERINSLSALSTPLATFGDKLKFLDRVQEAPICESRQLGKFSMRDVAIAGGTLEVPETPDKPKPTLAVIDAAFEETDRAVLEQIATAIEESSASLEAIEALFSEKCGAGIGPQPEAFATLLRDAAVQVRRRLGGGEEAAEGGEAGAEDGGGGGGGGGGSRIAGEVKTPADALLALDKVCRYYAENEPSSPVGLIVACAQQMVNKSFQQIAKVITPDVVTMLVNVSTPPAEENQS
jgi:type VI secretion system protein ImpA